MLFNEKCSKFSVLLRSQNSSKDTIITNVLQYTIYLRKWLDGATKILQFLLSGGGTQRATNFLKRLLWYQDFLQWIYTTLNLLEVSTKQKASTNLSNSAPLSLQKQQAPFLYKSQQDNVLHWCISFTFFLATHRNNKSTKTLGWIKRIYIIKSKPHLKE